MKCYLIYEDKIAWIYGKDITITNRYAIKFGQ
jgi:hypothetical protein